MPNTYNIDKETVRNKPSINYLGKDFISIKQDLIQHAKSYFPNTYQDFNETSPGMMMVELSAYVGDVLSFYIDQQFKEMFLTTATERKNIYQLAKSMGYKPKPSSAAFVNLLFRQKVPAIGSGPNKSPDMTEALVIDKGMIVKSGVNDITFQTLDVCDFNATGSDLLPSAFDSSTGVPTEYILSQYIPAASMETRTETFIVDSPQQFKKLTLQDTNVLSIERCIDASGNRWYEVDSLAQDKIFDSTHWTTDSRTNSFTDGTGNIMDISVPYKLNGMMKVNRRFVREVNSDLTTSLIFGNGIVKGSIEGENNLEEIFDNSQELNSLIKGNLPSDFDPTISYSSLGESPANTTMTITYKVGGGPTSNVPSGVINKVISYNLLTSGHSTSTEDTLTVLNLTPAGGGKAEETVDEIRQQIKANFNSQNRVVTKSDYEARIKALPGRFGNVAKVFVKRKGVGDLSADFNIFDFNQDEDANNIPDTNPNVVGGPNDQLAYNTLFANIINADAGTQATVNQEQIDFLNSLSTFINNLSGFSTTNFTGFKNLDIHILSFDNSNHLVGSPSLLKLNLENYLNNFKTISDEFNITNAYVINFGIKFSVTAHTNYNRQDIKLKCIDELKKYFDISNMEINKPINISDVKNLLYSVEGVKLCDYVKISQLGNVLGTSYNLWSPGGNPSNGVSGVGKDNYGFAYDFEQFQGPDSNGIIKPAHITTPSIFELKNPNDNIKGVVS